jgi:ubiquinone/menaquinone biosynthesis C-methylase UbiE
LAIETVEKRVSKAGLANVQTILTDRDTGLPDESVDVVLLYDMLHLVNDKQALLKELYRVLKADGFLSADHEHTAKEAFLQTVTSGQMFALLTQNGTVFQFGKLVEP